MGETEEKQNEQQNALSDQAHQSLITVSSQRITNNQSAHNHDATFWSKQVCSEESLQISIHITSSRLVSFWSTNHPAFGWGPAEGRERGFPPHLSSQHLSSWIKAFEVDWLIRCEGANLQLPGASEDPASSSGSHFFERVVLFTVLSRARIEHWSQPSTCWRAERIPNSPFESSRDYLRLMLAFLEPFSQANCILDKSSRCRGEKV